MAVPDLPDRIGFIGLGLIASSLARALRAGGYTGHLIGWDTNPEALATGLSLKVIDASVDSVEALVSEAGLVVVGAPPVATAEILKQVLPSCAGINPPPVVTDLASIKGYIADAVVGDFPFFVPGHPIAGSEDSGVAAGRADLFAGREVILTPRSDTSEGAAAVVEAMWLMTGAWLSTMPLEDHDAALAASSHSPHMVAYALTKALGSNPYEPMRHGGGALRDMTRIAGSDPVMWRDVALTNRAALLDALDDFTESMAELRQLVDDADGEGLKRFFLACRQIRREHDRILNPLLADSSKKSSTT